MSQQISLSRDEAIAGALDHAYALIATGKHVEAEDLLLDVLRADVGNHAAYNLLALLACQYRKFDISARLAEQATRLAPDSADCHVTQGRAYRGLGRHQEAEKCFRRATALDPGHVDAHVLRGLSLKATGNIDAAAGAFREALRLAPQCVEASINLANILRETGLTATAAALYREAAELAPLSAHAQGALAASLVEQGNRAEALSRYRRAAELDPSITGMSYMAGRISQDEGDHAQAVEHYRNVVAREPDNADAWVNLGLALIEMARYADALNAFVAAIGVAPRDVEAYANLAVVLSRFGRSEESIAAARRACELRPDNAFLMSNLGATLVKDFRFDEAERILRRAVEIDPHYGMGHANLGMALRGPGRQTEAVACLRRAIELDPENGMAHDQLAMAMNYAEELTPKDIVDAARASGLRVYGGPVRPAIDSSPMTAGNASSATARRVRIGYVSPDLHRHSVSYFLEPVLSNHDRAQFEISCFYLYARNDEVTMRLRGLVDHWVDAYNMPPDELDKTIRDHGIDILIDLAGHTANHGLAAFARKPAAVQMTWLGFPTTVGVPAIDYRLTDWEVDPQGYEAFNTEQPLRLRHSYFCYRPDVAPDVAPLPALDSRGVTFGSFNNLAKLSRPTVELWTGVLDAVPGSRLILKGRGSSERLVLERVREAFRNAGLAPDRLIVRDWADDMDSHLDGYSQIDIGLDTFPYNGATTTCEALWMGVPVVSLCGRTQASRMGRSILTAAGLPHLVADSSVAFTGIASGLAGDVSRLGDLRASMRERLRASALMDERVFTRDIEARFRDVLVSRGSA